MGNYARCEKCRQLVPVILRDTYIQFTPGGELKHFRLNVEVCDCGAVRIAWPNLYRIVGIVEGNEA